MATTDIVGQTLPLAIAYLDQNGHPMLSPPTLDAPPVWTDDTPATETLTASADGLSASALAVAPGTDTVKVSLSVGGVTFSATLAVTVAAVPQVLTSVEILPGPPA